MPSWEVERTQARLRLLEGEEPLDAQDQLIIDMGNYIDHLESAFTAAFHAQDILPANLDVKVAIRWLRKQGDTSGGLSVLSTEELMRRIIFMTFDGMVPDAEWSMLH